MDLFELAPYRVLLKEPGKEEYERVLELLLGSLSAERGCFYLEKESLFLYKGDEELRKTFPFSRQAVDAVLDDGCSFISFDPDKDDRINPTGSIRLNQVRSCVCSACVDESGEVLVLAYFDNSVSHGAFTQETLDKLRKVLELVPGAVSG